MITTIPNLVPYYPSVVIDYGWFLVNAGMLDFFAILAGYYMGDYVKRRWWRDH